MTDSAEVYEHHAAMLAYARRLLVDWPELQTTIEPEDVVQRVLANQVKRAESEGRSFELPDRDYLLKCVRNRVYDDRRRLRTQRKRLGSAVPWDEPGLQKREELQVPATQNRVGEESDATRARRETARRLAELRRLVERLRAEPGRGVDYHAVLLLQLRLVLAARAGEALTAQGRSVVDTVASWLPWDGAVSGRPLRPGWPSIGDLWQACCDDLEQKPHRVGADILGERVSELSGGKHELSADAWYKWSSRAKDKAKERMSPEEWSTILEPFLPQRPRRGGDQ